MKKSRRTYNGFQLVSAIFMIMALLWLTVSAPFINASRQEHAAHHSSADAGSPLAGNEEESANPFGGTEEKAPTTGNSVSEEFLHDPHIADHFFSVASQYHKCENAGIYIAFHGDIHVPPPNMA